MSQDNVEIVKRFLPSAGIEPLVAPDFEVTFISWEQRTESRGSEGFRRAWLDWLTPWASYYDEIEKVFAAGDDRLVVMGREHGFRRDTTEPAAALEAVGLWE